jgi:hypothetical protein
MPILSISTAAKRGLPAVPVSAAAAADVIDKNFKTG